VAQKIVLSTKPGQDRITEGEKHEVVQKKGLPGVGIAGKGRVKRVWALDPSNEKEGGNDHDTLPPRRRKKLTFVIKGGGDVKFRSSSKLLNVRYTQYNGEGSKEDTQPLRFCHNLHSYIMDQNQPV